MDSELKRKFKMVHEINRLAEARNAIILKHNYMEPVLFRNVNGCGGDSLELSRQAARADSDVIVFCGVRFMAETAKILNPKKLVLIPSANAGCSLADNITAQDVRSLRRKFPSLPVVAYVNTSAAVKAESDICCTSGNAQMVVKWALGKFKTKSLIFIPDKYLAQNIARQMKMAVWTDSEETDPADIDYENKPTIIGWDACCYVHDKFTPDDAESIRKNYPGAIILAHPECRPEVIAAADFSGSTSRMADYVRVNGANKKIALLTECSMADNLCAAFPKIANNLIRLRSLRCEHMQTITLDLLLDSLLADIHQIDIPEKIREKAELAVKRMIEIN